MVRSCIISVNYRLVLPTRLSDWKAVFQYQEGLHHSDVHFSRLCIYADSLGRIWYPPNTYSIRWDICLLQYQEYGCSNEAEIEADNVSFAEKGTENRNNWEYIHIWQMGKLLTLFSIGAISGIRDCQYEPLVIFSILVVEIFTRRFEATVQVLWHFQIDVSCLCSCCDYTEVHGRKWWILDSNGTLVVL